MAVKENPVKACFPLLALVALAAGPALAQSSVSLSGIVDLGLRQVHNTDVGTLNSMVSGSNATSRFILRGSEDLGGGLSAGFHLESGLNADTGQSASSSTLFDRRATVGLVSKTLGEIRLGNDYVPSYLNWNRYDPFSVVGVARTSNLISATPAGPIKSAFGANPNTTVRASNSLQLLLPELGGLEGGLMVAAGEGGTAANGQHRVVGARLGWATKTFGGSVATTRTRNDQTGDEDFRDTAVGGFYDAGVVRLSAGWRQFRHDQAKQTNLLVGASVPVGAAGSLKLSWNRAAFGGSAGGVALDGQRARQLGIGYVHELSRRTALYGSFATLDNDGALKLSIPGGPSGLPAGGRSRGLEFGVRHHF